jgi:hypothetical protein
MYKATIKHISELIKIATQLYRLIVFELLKAVKLTSK